MQRRIRDKRRAAGRAALRTALPSLTLPFNGGAVLPLAGVALGNWPLRHGVAGPDRRTG